MTRNQRLMARAMGVVALGAAALATPSPAAAGGSAALTPCELCEDYYYCDQINDLESACQFYCNGRHYKAGSCQENSEMCGGTSTYFVCFP